jgi:hypothetical protein
MDPLTLLEMQNTCLPMSDETVSRTFPFLLLLLPATYHDWTSLLRKHFMAADIEFATLL